MTVQHNLHAKSALVERAILLALHWNLVLHNILLRKHGKVITRTYESYVGGTSLHPSSHGLHVKTNPDSIYMTICYRVRTDIKVFIIMHSFQLL